MKLFNEFLAFLFLLGVFLSAPAIAFGEETAKSLKESATAGKKSTLRESEILGTLEKPQISTELPWRNPEGYNLNSPQPHRSFKKEIFRPIQPFSETSKKPDLK